MLSYRNKDSNPTNHRPSFKIFGFCIADDIRQNKNNSMIVQAHLNDWTNLKSMLFLADCESIHKIASNT